MKKILINILTFGIVIAVIVILLVSFGSSDGNRYVYKGNMEYKAVNIKAKEYQCSECSMDIEALDYAVQLISEDGNTYFFDEPSSYLDIKQRLLVAKKLNSLRSGNTFIVEHDLIMLGYMSDLIHIMFGKPSVYGIVSSPLSEKEGINTFIEGYLKNENIRFREKPLEFMKSKIIPIVVITAGLYILNGSAKLIISIDQILFIRIT